MTDQLPNQAPNENPEISQVHARITIKKLGDIKMMTTTESFTKLKQLFKDTLSGGDSRCKEQIEKIRGPLYIKAWIFCTVTVILRIVAFLSDKSYLWIAYRQKDQYENLNLEFVNQTEAIFKGFYIFMLILGVFLCVLPLKNRQYAKLLIYYRLIMMFPEHFVP